MKKPKSAKKTDSKSSAPDLARLRTGIPRFDYILNGGLIAGSTYTLQGSPGSGKTIFGNQICFNHIRDTGGTCVYITLLAESHAKMIRHMSTLDFFDGSAVPERMTYVSGYQSLKAQGPRGLIALARKSVKSLGATLLVIDGLQAAQQLALTPLDFDEFLHELQATTGMLGCTTLLLTPHRHAPGEVSENIVVDGVLEFTHTLTGARATRELIVHKLRGSDYLPGRHDFEITRAGVQVHPRTEAQVAQVGIASNRRLLEPSEEDRVRMRFGVDGLDSMLGGGVRSASLTTLAGAPGAGKTLLGLSFLVEGARRGQRGLYLGFHEPPARLIANAERVGIPLGEYVKSGAIELFWEPTLERPLDSLAERILERLRLDVAAPSVPRRLFLDGVDGFCLASPYPNRIAPFLSALVSQLRALGVTTLVTAELDLFASGTDNRPSIPTLSLISDCVILSRAVPEHVPARHSIAVLKMRESQYDGTVRELRIESEGLRVPSDRNRDREESIRGDRSGTVLARDSKSVPASGKSGAPAGKGARR